MHSRPTSDERRTTLHNIETVSWTDRLTDKAWQPDRQTARDGWAWPEGARGTGQAQWHCRNLCAVKINMQTLRFDGQLGKQTDRRVPRRGWQVNNFYESILGECTHTHTTYTPHTHRHTQSHMAHVRLQLALATFDQTLSGISNVLIIQFYLSAHHTHTHTVTLTHTHACKAHMKIAAQNEPKIYDACCEEGCASCCPV